ncbi:hypothetical protein G6653_08635 [Polynucleobacter paneuropaeus]|jgi:hypothetical protein|nr:hypothetical protein [Polynucleobacter paneuropaeus]MBT8612028.1 hypothetical protein [Polynucleobacter paneuropaeus]
MRFNSLRGCALLISFFFCQLAISQSFMNSTANERMGDDLIPYVGSNFEYDSNLFLLPASSNPSGSGSTRSDQSVAVYAGVGYTKTYSLQKIDLNVRYVDTKFQNSKFLDYGASNYALNWLVGLTPELSGKLLFTRDVNLTSFIDYRNTSSQNLNTLTTQVGELAHSFAKAWNIVGGFSHVNNAYSNENFNAINNFWAYNEIFGGVKYGTGIDGNIFSSNLYGPYIQKEASLILSRKNGQQTPSNSYQVGPGFNENQIAGVANWEFTPKSKIYSELKYTNRVYGVWANRNYSGASGDLGYQYKPTSKTELKIVAVQSLVPYEDLNSGSYYVARFASINAAWKILEKSKITANVNVGKRNYFNPPQPFLDAPARVDNMAIYSLEYTWVPRENSEISANLTHQSRTTNLQNPNFANWNFANNSVAIKAVIYF